MSHDRQLKKLWNKMQFYILNKSMDGLKTIKRTDGFLPLSKVNQQLGFAFHFESHEIQLLLRILQVEKKIKIDEEFGIRIRRARRK